MTPDRGRELGTEPLTAWAFAPFGEVLEAAGDPEMLINNGLCERFDDRAMLSAAGAEGRLGISIFRSRLCALPYRFDLLERHPLGSQAFLPMDAARLLVIVAPDEGDRPGVPRVFLAGPGQGVNYRRGTWHGVLAPLSGNGLFAVVDRIGPGCNLEEHRLPAPVTVAA